MSARACALNFVSTSLALSRNPAMCDEPSVQVIPIFVLPPVHAPTLRTPARPLPRLLEATLTLTLGENPFRVANNNAGAGGRAGGTRESRVLGRGRER
eukprot:scaffold277926_cov38-Tisochrysis_lutea.AAC.3